MLSNVPPDGQIDAMSESELDKHIDDCGLLMAEAHLVGSRAEAKQWQLAMYAAIAGRTPAHKARLEASIMARMADPANCYFSEAGALSGFRLTGIKT